MILQHAYQRHLIYVFICDSFHFPYNLYHEPKLVRIFIPYSFEYRNFFALAISNYSGGRGGVGEDGVEDGETVSGVGGGGIYILLMFEEQE